MNAELTVTDVKLIARYGITPEQIAATKAAETARVEALRPDADKLRAWADQLLHVPPPAVTSREAAKAIAAAGVALESLVANLRAFDRVDEAAE